ncbi:Sec-independent protein translocase protein TatB [Dietzia cinnamea]|uniref:Sec-independent protein translocase protein TatB n=2 Tax=Dietzia cinnamea TaxID=321318 RepID=UPI0021A7FF1B|nr:Sec-independent protein translocase protein TatB [Dietzia cinnamea]MCT2058819.1 Sec-independent protein translocase protein TatB [Dietzia cinnamea]
MFTNVGWSELLVLGVIALVVLGPERLPEAARWLASAIRKVREFASNAQQQLKDDYGTDFEEFREPLKQLNDLRGMSPRAMVTKHLLDGDDSLFTGDFGAAAPAGGAAVAGGAGAGGAPGGGAPAPPPPPPTPAHSPKVGDPRRTSTTTSKTVPDGHSTYFACPGGTSA